MDIVGTLKVKGSEMQVSEKFKKREFVITDNSSQYPQHIQFEVTQDKCGILDNYAVGSEIRVHFNIRGREWTNKEGQVKYFNTLQAWKLENAGSGNAGGSTHETQAESFSASGNEADDLPF